MSAVVQIIAQGHVQFGPFNNRKRTLPFFALVVSVLPSGRSIAEEEAFSFDVHELGWAPDLVFGFLG